MSKRNAFDTLVGNEQQQQNPRTSTVADDVEPWPDLVGEKSSPGDILKMAEARCVKSKVFNNISLAANFFHPIYRGQKFDVAQRKQVESFVLDALGTEGLNSFRIFATNGSIFGKLNERKITCPATFWHFAEAHHPELTGFVQKLQKIPASTAQLERLSSNWGFIHPELRDRLSPETSKKLLNIFYLLRVNDNNPDICLSDVEDN